MSATADLAIVKITEARRHYADTVSALAEAREILGSLMLETDVGDGRVTLYDFARFSIVDAQSGTLRDAGGFGEYLDAAIGHIRSATEAQG
jgi:hypothetical protein